MKKINPMIWGINALISFMIWIVVPLIVVIGAIVASYHFGYKAGETSGKHEAKYATRQSISDAAWADVEKCKAKFKASEEADMKKACNSIASTALSVSMYVMLSK